MRKCKDARSIATLYGGSGKTCLITGATAGFGLATALALAGAGAVVIMACRPGPKADAALANVRKAAVAAGGNEANVHLIPLDLASAGSVRACADTYTSLLPQLPRNGALTALVLNAGCLAMPWGSCGPTSEPALQINLLGHALLHERLAPHLLAAGADARVVCVASASHYRIPGHGLDWDVELPPRGPDGYDEHRAYAMSNLCRVLWAKALAERVPYPVVSLHPACSGGTEAGRHMGLWTLLRLLSLVFYWEWRGIIEFQSVEQGARTQTFLAVASPEALRELTGRYLSGNTSDGPLGAPVVPSTFAQNDEYATRVLNFVANYVQQEMHA
jgi:NAD(P)-dependent dehydrogenase (short-subunit alcohol dehydrogenase family)